MDAKKENMNLDDIDMNEALTETDMSDDILEGDEEKIREITEKSAIGLLWALISFLLGGAVLPFGAMPFGVALLSSASSKLPYIYAGLCVSAFSAKEGGLVYFCAYSAVLLIRVISRIIIDNPFSEKEEGDQNEQIPNTLGEIFPILFSEHICLRMATSCIGAFIIGIYTLVKGGFLYYDLWGMIIGMAVAPFAVYLYCGLSGNGGALGIDRSLIRAHVSENRRFGAVCALAASLILACNEITVMGMSVSLFGAMMITLYFCRRKGIMYGLVIGTLCGIAYSPMLAPLFAFAALTSGALWRVSSFFACLSACSVGIAWGLYTEGIAALTSVLPATLAACLIFAVVDKLYISEHMMQKVYEQKAESEEADGVCLKKIECEVLGEEALSPIVLDDTEQKIKVMCETFSSLSSLFYSLSEKMRTPAASDLKQICDNAFDSCCQGCEMRSTCWESEYASSLSSVSKICSALGKNGHITEDDVSPRMAERCSSMPDIIDQINRNSMMHTQQLIIGDKTEIFALDYEAVSDLLAATMNLQREEFEYDEELSLAAKKMFDERADQTQISITQVFATKEFLRNRRK